MSFKQKFNILIDKIDSVDSKFEIIDILGHGAMGYIYKVRDKSCPLTNYEYDVVIKCREKSSVRLRDFQREVFYSYLLSAHRNIVNTFNVAYETPTDYIMVQEVAPYGTLINWVPKRRGLDESPAAKDIVRQIASAIDFMHSKDVVHCDIRPENILVFQHEQYEMARDENVTPATNTTTTGSSLPSSHQPPGNNNPHHNLQLSSSFFLPHIAQNLTNLNIPLLNRTPSFSSTNVFRGGGGVQQSNLSARPSATAITTGLSNSSSQMVIKILGSYQIKLAGFDKSLKRGTLIKKLAKANSYSAPEICDKFYKEGYVVEPSADVWAFGILVYYILTGQLPWLSAIEDSDPDFTEFVRWLRRKRLNPPPNFKCFTDKFCKFFRKVFDLKRDKRCVIKDINKYMSEHWKRTGDEGLTKSEIEGLLIDPVIAAHQRCHHHQHDDDDESTGSDSYRIQIEEFEQNLAKRGVQTEIDKSDRKRRIEAWLQNNPSDASLPTMGEAFDVQEDLASQASEPVNLSKSLNYSYSYRRKVPNFKNRRSKSPNLIADLTEEDASTTKPTGSFSTPPNRYDANSSPRSNPRSAQNSQNRGKSADHYYLSSSPPFVVADELQNLSSLALSDYHPTPAVTPRVSIDESFGPLPESAKQSPNHPTQTYRKSKSPPNPTNSGKADPNQRINNDVQLTKSPKYSTNHQLLSKDGISPVVPTAQQAPPVSIFLEQASSDSGSDNVY